MQTEKAALKLVQPITRAKRPTKTEMVAALESSNTALNEHVADLTAKLYALENPLQSEVVESIRITFNKRNRLPALYGSITGGWAPLASYIIAHVEIQGNYAAHPILTALVIGALLFSAPTVYQSFLQSFHGWVKALGLVVLIEGTMIFSKIQLLGYSALTLLIVINAIEAARNLAIRKQKPEFQF